jgi:hypothetical protein
LEEEAADANQLNELKALKSNQLLKTPEYFKNSKSPLSIIYNKIN